MAIAQSAAKDGEAMAGVLRRALARLELPPAALDRAHEFVYEELLALSEVEDAEERLADRRRRPGRAAE